MPVQSLVFATHNQNKVEEIHKMMPENYQVLSLQDIQFGKEITEDQDSLKGNALKKAKTVYEETGYSCFADDTGLEVDALNSEPGVYSARYSGKNASDQENIELLLNNLNGINNRQARFRTVIALILDKEEFLFEGIAEGMILEKQQGKEGFGYDPVFRPYSYKQTFAELPMAEKNKISHRGKAFDKMIGFLAQRSYLGD